MVGMEDGENFSETTRLSPIRHSKVWCITVISDVKNFTAKLAIVEEAKFREWTRRHQTPPHRSR
jgi:hypothetical protein